MIVDNFNLISSLLEPDDNNQVAPDRFYFLQILQRGKDAGCNRCIKTYFIESPEYLLSKKDEIVKLCEMFKARAYINLNPRSYKKCTMQTIAYMAQRASDGDFKKIYKSWNTICGSCRPELKEQKFLVDVDTQDQESLEKIKRILEEVHYNDLCKKSSAKLFENLWRSALKGNTPVIEKEFIDEIKEQFLFATIPTKHGYHLLVKPFNIQDFQQKSRERNGNMSIDVHRDNPTILYIPEL